MLQLCILYCFLSLKYPTLELMTVTIESPAPSGTGAKIITHSLGGAGGTGTAGGAASTTSTIITPTSTTGMNVGTGGSGRLVGRTPILPPNSPQGSGAPLYVVTTNSGTITVVTRTVAAGQGIYFDERNLVALEMQS